MKRLSLLLMVAVMVTGCVGDEGRGEGVKDNVSITLPPTISYEQAIEACNLTNLVGISLNNYKGKWVWELTFENGSTIFCRVDGDGKRISITEFRGTLHSNPIPLGRIRIDEHAAFKAAVENGEVAKWIGSREVRIDRISLESSPKVTLWRIYFSAGKSFLMVAVNATSGDIISVRGASFNFFT